MLHSYACEGLEVTLVFFFSSFQKLQRATFALPVSPDPSVFPEPFLLNSVPRRQTVMSSIVQVPCPLASKSTSGKPWQET